MQINPVRLILSAGLVLLVLRYLSVLIGGYDVFEGINDLKADWVNYLTGGALGFEVGKRKGIPLAIGMGALFAVICESIRWLLIVFGLAKSIGWDWDFIGQRWPIFERLIIENQILVTLVISACALTGAWLAQWKWLRERHLPVSLRLFLSKNGS